MAFACLRNLQCAERENSQQREADSVGQFYTEKGDEGNHQGQDVGEDVGGCKSHGMDIPPNAATIPGTKPGKTNRLAHEDCRREESEPLG